jgi:methionine-rich copper-binding protein CopC
MRSGRYVVAAGLLLVLASPFSAAQAHGDIRSSSPAAGERLDEPPGSVSLVLAEPAAQGSTLVVRDGCGERVSGAEVIDGANFSAPIDGGRPGSWKVVMRSISAVDGHAVDATFSFRVAGQRDCSEEPRTPTPDESATISSRPPIANPDPPDSGGFPIVPFAVGTVVLVGLALAVRKPWAKS